MANRHRNRLTYPHPWKLRVASVALVLKWLAGLTALAALAMTGFSNNRTVLLLMLAALGAFVVFAAISTALAAELPCKVCRHPALKAKGCRKHEKARAFLGLSHPLSVAVSVLVTNRFRCFYCGERIPLASRKTQTEETEVLLSSEQKIRAQPDEFPSTASAASSSQLPNAVPANSPAGEDSVLPARR